MSDSRFNYDSLRAQKARLALSFNRLLIALLLLSTLSCILGGLFLTLSGTIYGIVVISLAAIPLVTFLWWKEELRDIPSDQKSSTIDGLLESSVLAHLTKSPSPQSIAEAVMKTPGGHFFAARFGIGPSFLQHTMSDNQADTQKVWDIALELSHSSGEQKISGAMMVLALLRSHPEAISLLAHLQLEEADIGNGVRWYDHIHEIIAEQNKVKRTGGIARDWSFGYTPLLQRFGINISDQIARGGLLSVQLEAHTQALSQLIATFSSGGRQNITLVGPTGSGKTTIVHALAQQLLDGNNTVPSQLKYRQIIMLDASSLISAAPGRGELEQLVNQLLIEAYKAKNIILCLDDAQLFFEEGVGSVDISNVLLPILEGGALKLILTMDEQRWLQISQRNPALVNSLNRVMVAPASRQETMLVLQDQLILTEYQRKVTYMYQSLSEAYRLSERYVHELAMPGRALKLLESAAGYAESGLVTARSVQDAIEKTMNIKVAVASSGDERGKLLNLEDLIHKRMINQTRAVKVVSDALRRARAGVRNENRPIGTFLFLGPTGVGKTELSKALADVYFGGEDRLLRIDMNEYVNPNDVTRLIADGAEDSHSLTAQVMKQPFSVILLDEIEKAHPNVLATLLQMLDEGILRDIKNREVSFRDAIVIATSNAGAQQIRQHIEKGEKLEDFEDQLVNELINSQQFRPEFLNRFDEIVVFRPLNKEELLQVIDLILAGINKNLALQKVSVNVSDEAKLWLVDKGYDPRLGARPMRRVVQRTVENLVAKQMLGSGVAPGGVVEVSLADVQAQSDT